jgi:hypothetical protein
MKNDVVKKLYTDALSRQIAKLEKLQLDNEVRLALLLDLVDKAIHDELHDFKKRTCGAMNPEQQFEAVFQHLLMTHGPHSSLDVRSLTAQLSELSPTVLGWPKFLLSFNHGVTATTPSGWTLQESGGNGNYLFTRVRQNGDSDPSLALSGGATGIVAAIALHTSGATNGPLIDQKNSQLGSGTPSSATLSSLTPATATEYLIAAWGQVSGSSSTWTPSGSLTNEVSSGYGPSLIVMDTQPASQPTGTFTTGSSLNTAIFASELLVQAVMPPSGAPISSIIM